MWFDSPDSNSVFRQVHEHRRRDFCFSSFGRLLCVFLISGRKSTNGYAGRLSEGLPNETVPDADTFYGSPEFRRAYPHRTCLTPLLEKPERLSRKKNMSRPGASQTLRKTSDSELGGIHFAHFPGDKGYYKNSSNVSLSGSTAWKSIGKTEVPITLFISSYYNSFR